MNGHAFLYRHAAHCRKFSELYILDIDSQYIYCYAVLIR